MSMLHILLVTVACTLYACVVLIQYRWMLLYTVNSDVQNSITGHNMTYVASFTWGDKLLS